jgi:outer membrane receptor for ferrienterochelin and colicin
MRSVNSPRVTPIVIALALVALVAAAAFGQARVTGSLTGKVTSDDQSPLPGVTVTATSPALQGERSAVTDENGDYILRDLPAGEYEIAFTLEGLVAQTRPVTIQVGRLDRLEIELRPEAVSEEIVVTAESPSALETTEISANFEAEEVDTLAINRDLDAIADLAPGLTTNVANVDQVTINGAFGFDSKFLVNGVEINDNLFGTFTDLFIEDAVQETQVLTSGISAEYGRFTGGVVNVITKSGGNQFTGGARVDFTNPSWRNETPFEEENGIERESKNSEVLSATLGGYILRDRLWFFAAARDFENDAQDTLDVSGFAFSPLDEDQRFEGKLTANPATNHSLQFSYTDDELDQANRRSIGQTVDPAGLQDGATRQDLVVGRYSGVLTESLFAEAQYSEKHSNTVRGGDAGSLPEASPFIAFGLNFAQPVSHYNAPYFDRTDPEDRDNEQIAANVSWFASSAGAGTHDLKIGAEHFTDINTGGNSQTPTNQVFLVDFVQDATGAPVLDAQNRFTPFWGSFFDGFLALRNEWLPARGSILEVETLSYYVNDRWTLNDHWSFNIGARFEDADSTATGDIEAIDMSRLVPRLGASFDLKGDGRFVFDASYAEYSGTNTINNASQNSNVGNPSLIQWLYVGPSGVGVDFAPAYALESNWVPVFARFPTESVITAELESPASEEIALSFGQRLGTKGFYKVTLVDRETSDIVEDFFLFENGQVNVPADMPTTAADVVVNANTELASREYRGLQVQGDYRISQNFRIAGNYTYQDKNDGNFVGEATNQPVISSAIGDYPELFPTNRHAPFGRLPAFQEHKVRVFPTYTLEVGRAGDLLFGALFNYDSGTPFDLFDNDAACCTSQQNALDPGYAAPPTTQDIYFAERGSELFDGAFTTNLAVTWALPIVRDLELRIKGEVRNVFDDDSLIAHNTQVTGDPDGPVDAVGLPLDFVLGPRFGEGESEDDFVVPREYRFSVGIRF